ncbi:MAG TPA: hypothetical protein VK447_13780 [Myxococcaceae bacterium]|nr:hypothetical protein [Myxococcaceae bacterium]
MIEPCPHEIPAPLKSEEVVEEHRNLYCGHYDACLDVAVKSGWASWSCMRCPLKHVASGTRPTALEFAQDRRGDAGSL